MLPNGYTATMEDDAGGRFTVESNGTIHPVSGQLDYGLNPSHDLVIRVTEDSTGNYRLFPVTIPISQVISSPNDTIPIPVISFANPTGASPLLSVSGLVPNEVIGLDWYIEVAGDSGFTTGPGSEPDVRTHRRMIDWTDFTDSDGDGFPELGKIGDTLDQIPFGEVYYIRLSIRRDDGQNGDLSNVITDTVTQYPDAKLSPDTYANTLYNYVDLDQRRVVSDAVNANVTTGARVIEGRSQGIYYGEFLCENLTDATPPTMYVGFEESGKDSWNNLPNYAAAPGNGSHKGFSMYAKNLVAFANGGQEDFTGEMGQTGIISFVIDFDNNLYWLAHNNVPFWGDMQNLTGGRPFQRTSADALLFPFVSITSLSVTSQCTLQFSDDTFTYARPDGALPYNYIGRGEALTPMTFLAAEGDSNSAGSNSFIQNWMDDNPTISSQNFAVGGSGLGNATDRGSGGTATMWGRIEDVIAAAPSHIHILIGTNDLPADTTGYFNRLVEYIDALKAEVPGIKSIVAMVPPKADATFNDRRTQFNDILRANVGNGFEYLNPLGQHPIFTNAAGFDTNIIPDGTHWGTFAGTKVREVTYPVLNSIRDEVTSTVPSFSFVDVPEANPTTEYETTAVISGLRPGASVSVTSTGDGSFKMKNDDYDTSPSSPYYNGDVISVKLTSTAAEGSVSQSVSAGGTTDSFDVTIPPPATTESAVWDAEQSNFASPAPNNLNASDATQQSLLQFTSEVFDGSNAFLVEPSSASSDLGRYFSFKVNTTGTISEIAWRAGRGGSASRGYEVRTSQDNFASVIYNSPDPMTPATGSLYNFSVPVNYNVNGEFEVRFYPRGGGTILIRFDDVTIVRE